MKKLFCSFFCLLFISSCSGNKQGFGTVVGGATGALVGSSLGKGTGRLVGVGLGAIAGGMVGNQIGQYMDEKDKMKMKRVSYSALENTKSGQTSSWKNPDSGNSGSITPVKTYEDSGRYCREYTQTVNIAGKTHEAYGTACRQPNGSWEIKK